MERNCINENKQTSAEDLEAIRKWNAFTEPLRKEFGIPRWKPGADRKEPK